MKNLLNKRKIKRNNINIYKIFKYNESDINKTHENVKYN